LKKILKALVLSANGVALFGAAPALAADIP